MARYGQAFKDKAVARLLPQEHSESAKITAGNRNRHASDVGRLVRG